jgi:hypothetical protein
VSAQTRLLTYVVANWHLLTNRVSNKDFWQDLKAASCLLDEKPRVYTDDRRTAAIKESMMRALSCELERAQYYLFDNEVLIVDPSVRQQSESADRSDNVALAKFLQKTYKTPTLTVNGKPLQVDLVRDDIAYRIVLKNTMGDTARKVLSSDHWIPQVKQNNKDAHLSLITRHLLATIGMKLVPLDVSEPSDVHLLN